MKWHDIPSLAALRAFETAARHGSFSAAARDLNVTHAAIGQHVRALENHFGQSLMQRVGRGMAVTPDGRLLADRLSDAFGMIASATHDLLDQSKSRAIRVALTPSFASDWLMPRIGAFWDAHPDIEIELLPAGKLVDLRRDNVDVAIRYGKGGWAGSKSTKLMPAGHVAVATKSYLASARSIALMICRACVGLWRSHNQKNGFGWPPTVWILMGKTSLFFKQASLPARLRARA